MSMAHSAVVVVVDRLSPWILGPYGNTWVQTPELNRIAADSLVLDQAVIDTPGLDGLYRSYWQGTHAAQRITADSSDSSAGVIRRLREAGIHTALLSDDPQVLEHSLASEFAEIVAVPAPETAEPAESEEETHLARLFAEAASWTSGFAAAHPGGDRPVLLWVHARGLAADWDAPYELRKQYADAEDPQPPDWTTPPERMLPEDYEPDELLGIVHAYAGQVSLLDTCLGALYDQLHDLPGWDQTLLALFSARGFPLGEHRRVGACDNALHSELVQFAALLQLPELRGAGRRSSALVQPADVPATLVDWWQLPQEVIAPRPVLAGQSLLGLAAEPGGAGRDRAYVVSERQAALRTPAWHLRLVRPEEESEASLAVELYAKPDDRFEVNEVSVRLPEATAALVLALENLQAHASDASQQLQVLDDVLLYGAD